MKELFQYGMNKYPMTTIVCCVLFAAEILGSIASLLGVF